MTKDYNLKNPATQVAWLAGIKDKIFNATGIPPYKLVILTMNVSKTEKSETSLAYIWVQDNCGKNFSIDQIKWQW